MSSIVQGSDHCIDSIIRHRFVVDGFAINIILVDNLPCLLNKLRVGARLIALVEGVSKERVSKPATKEGDYHKGSNSKKLSYYFTNMSSAARYPRYPRR